MCGCNPSPREGGRKDFEFDFELDLEQNEFESFELPEIFLGRYMHDFKVRNTVTMGLDYFNLKQIKPVKKMLAVMQ